MGRLHHWWFRRWSRHSSYPRAALAVMMASVYLALGVQEGLQNNDETLTWLLVGGSALFIAQAAADFSYRRRHGPPPKKHWHDALG